MDQVESGLFVGTLQDAGNASMLREHEVTHILSLTHDDPSGGFPGDVTVVDVPMTDGPQNDRRSFEQAVTETLAVVRAGNRVLVHCSAGASRSPSVAALVIALARSISLEDVFDQVDRRRSAVDPHVALVQQAARVYSDSSRLQTDGDWEPSTGGR